MNQSPDPKSLKEMLSALADDEHVGNYAEDELIELMCEDGEARSAWQSLHLTRDVLQADYNVALDETFAAKLSAVIDQNETTYSGTDSKYASTTSKASKSNVVPLRTRRPMAPAAGRAPQTAPFSVWKPIAGLGLAASLAGATFLFPQLWNANQSANGQIANVENSGVTINVADNSNLNAANNILAVHMPQMQVDDAGTRWRMESEVPRDADVEERLNALLTNHLEDASMGVVLGLVSHSRVVSYDSASQVGF